VQSSAQIDTVPPAPSFASTHIGGLAVPGGAGSQSVAGFVQGVVVQNPLVPSLIVRHDRPALHCSR
jgi:hypothetical protein